MWQLIESNDREFVLRTLDGDTRHMFYIWGYTSSSYPNGFIEFAFLGPKMSGLDRLYNSIEYKKIPIELITTDLYNHERKLHHNVIDALKYFDFIGSNDDVEYIDARLYPLEKKHKSNNSLTFAPDDEYHNHYDILVNDKVVASFYLSHTIDHTPPSLIFEPRPYLNRATYHNSKGLEIHINEGYVDGIDDNENKR